MQPSRKLSGWKSISRHLGRSPRAVQSWESERKLPIHRVPGGRGSVFAYAEEVDAWLTLDAGSSGVGVQTVSTSAPTTSSTAFHSRSPGILVLPLDRLDATQDTGPADALCQRLIARLAQAQRSVRVLSWQTSKGSRQWVESLSAMAAHLDVRYVVEGFVDRSQGTRRVDLRIVDVELDQVVLADRFVSAPEASAHFEDEVAEAVATHFALIHVGALVETTCLSGTDPATLLDYLRAAQRFFDDRASTIDDVLASLERALARDPAFVPARAMKGLALLQSFGNVPYGEACIERVRTIAKTCTASMHAPLTTAFLNAAIAMVCDGDRPQAESKLAKVLRWLPLPIPSRGRLFERRSSLRPRADDGRTDQSTGDVSSAPTFDVFASLLVLFARVGERGIAPGGTMRR